MCFIEKSLNMNLDEEIRCGYKVSAQMKHIWNVQMNLLKKLLEACEKHNLRIWASSGTLLGAVRHGGYIPWDDDIDMVMMRDDDNKLLSIASAEFKARFHLIEAMLNFAWMGLRQSFRRIISWISIMEYLLIFSCSMLSRKTIKR